jgi:hypothetical protein
MKRLTARHFPLWAFAALLVLAAYVACPSQGDGSSGESGITGTVMMGPNCPVEYEGQHCPNSPYAATLIIRRPGSDRDVASVRSGQDGSFQLDLEPGDYVIIPVMPNPGGPPYAEPQQVAVEPGQYTRVTILYDSGVR